MNNSLTKITTKKVSSFKEFFSKLNQQGEKNSENTSIVPIEKEIAETIKPLVADPLTKSGLSNVKQNEFCEKVASFAASNTFISDLSDTIGEPEPSETEDEFVHRASNIMRELLTKKFGTD